MGRESEVSRMILSFLVQATGVNDGGVTGMSGEERGREVCLGRVESRLLASPFRPWRSEAGRGRGRVGEGGAQVHMQPPWGQVGFRIQHYSDSRKIIPYSSP